LDRPKDISAFDSFDLTTAIVPDKQMDERAVKKSRKLLKIKAVKAN